MGIKSRQKTKAKSLKKIDGVIEAVHRSPDGEVELVRFFERRGPTWSDLMLTERDGLVKRLKNGEEFVIGERKIYWAGTFNPLTQVQLRSIDGRDRLTTALSPDGKIELKEAPPF